MAYLIGVLGPGWKTKVPPQIQLLLRKNVLNSWSPENPGKSACIGRVQKDRREIPASVHNRNLTGKYSTYGEAMRVSQHRIAIGGVLT